MKQFVLADNLDTLTGMRLAGISGKLIQNDADFEPAFESVLSNKDIGLVLISPRLIETHQDLINEIRFQRAIPLITPVKGPNEWQQNDDNIAQTIQHAIGIQL